MPLRLPLLLGTVLLVLPAAAQQAATHSTLDWKAEAAAIEAEALARVRAANNFGQPADPPVDLSRLDLLSNADRLFVPNREAWEAGQADGGPVLLQHIIPPSETGTGFAEFLQYQLPTSYTPDGAPHPMVVAYHGYAGSHMSVALQSTIHLACEQRGWIYVSPIGLDSHFFGPPITHLHTEFAIDWMLDNHNVDTERLYMVGFSMGGGIAANFVSQHRDPDGLMFAGLGLCSSTLDWTQEHFLTPDPLSVHFYMEHALCFQGPPDAFPFNYRSAGGLFFDVPSYPPLPGNLIEGQSMATNLGWMPTYLTWDLDDVLAQVPPACATLVGVLEDVGSEHEALPITGTPSPHSWAVLDEEDLFDFLAERVVDRLPARFDAKVTQDASVSWVTLEQRNPDAFSTARGDTDVPSGALTVDGVVNVARLTVDVGRTGLGRLSSVRVTATSADSAGFTLVLAGFDAPPSYLLDAATGQLVAGVHSDPFADTLFIQVPGRAGLDVIVVSEPWLGRIHTTPQPAPNGGPMTLTIDGDPGDVAGWLTVGFAELLVPIKQGNVITTSPFPPALLVVLPLDAAGDVVVPSGIPLNPAFSGLEVLLQAVTITPATKVGVVTNMWRMLIE